jgi:putative MATE family efflux protein
MKKIYNLTDGPIIKKLLLVALPVLLTSLAQMAYNLTDMFWIGRVDEIGMNESAAIAAIGTAGYAAWLAFGFILFAKIGISVKISHAVGQNKPHDIDVYATNGLLLELVLGILYSLSIFIFRNEFLGIFKIDDQLTYNYALQYLPIIGGFMVFQFISSGFSAINEGLGQTKRNLIILAIGLVVNMVLDPILILKFGWGIKGAAIATVIAQGLTIIVFYLVYRRNNKNIAIFRFKEMNFKAIWNILKIGLQVGLHSILFTGISIYIARMVYNYGYQVVSAQRIGTQIEQLTWMIGGGFQTAITVFVGQNIGAKQFTRIRKGILYVSMILIPYSLFVVALLFFGSEGLIGIFSDDPEVIRIGGIYLTIISLSQIFMMLEAIGAGLFNGLGKSLTPSLNGIVGNIIRIPLATLLVVSLNEEGIWWSLNISSIFKGMVMVVAAVFILTRLEKLNLKSLNDKMTAKV